LQDIAALIAIVNSFPSIGVRERQRQTEREREREREGERKKGEEGEENVSAN